MSGAETVLVTGGSGYIGGWCVAGLLQQGYVVRTTVRDLGREAAVRAALGKIVDPGNRLSFYAANLTSDEGWDAAASGCDYVLHVASPLGVADPKDPNELIVPAREGARRAVGAAIKAGVRRVVLTSSVAAANKGARSVDWAHDELRNETGDWTSDETIWTDPAAPKVGVYAQSKLCNILFTREIARRLGVGGPTANCLHPGLVNSHLFHDSPALLRGVLAVLGRTFMLSPQQGARTSIYLAMSPEVAGASGGYYDRCRRVTPSGAAQSDADAERLWQASARLTGAG